MRPCHIMVGNGYPQNILIILTSDPEMVDTLKSKKAAFPTPSPVTVRKRKERKVTSAAAITEADSQRDN